MDGDPEVTGEERTRVFCKKLDNGNWGIAGPGITGKGQKVTVHMKGEWTKIEEVTKVVFVSPDKGVDYRIAATVNGDKGYDPEHDEDNYLHWEHDGDSYWMRWMPDEDRHVEVSKDGESSFYIPVHQMMAVIRKLKELEEMADGEDEEE
jgi:hypothetical protein